MYCVFITRSQRTKSRLEQSVPMVKVFPAPVCPYAKMAALVPLMKLFMAGWADTA